MCTACGAIHYENPRLVVGCIVEHADGLLLCKRAIEPRKGLWTVPAGFLEIGESTMAGAVRETYEEARARVEVIAPYAHFDVPHIGQSYVMYRARMLSPDFAPGPESEDVRLVPPTEVPWGELAFPVVRYALEFLLEDLEAGRYRAHHGSLAGRDQGYALREHVAITLEP